MSPRICYLANARSVFTVHWANRMAELGWDVHLVSWRPADSQHSLDPRVSLTRIVSPPHNALMATAFIEVAHHVRRIAPDIVHGHYVHTFGTLAGLYATLDSSRPVVVSAWGPHGLLHCGQPLRSLAKAALAKADVVNTMSNHLASILRDYYAVAAHKIVTFPWGIDTSRFHPGYDTEVCALRQSLGIPEKSSVMFSPRTMTPHYRIETIVHAAGLISHRGNDVHVVVAVGGSPDRNYLSSVRKLTQALGIRNKVLLVDRELDAKEMAVLYNMANATVSIPLDDQMGSCVVETMACGSVPIVAPLEAYKGYLTDGVNALLVDGDAPEEIATAFERAVSDAALRQRCQTVNPSLVQANESWEVNSRKMETLYQQLIRARREPR
ncbi:MAG: glycosyltransferase family 4 protein [Dehalococcoidia bacterium]|nr:glycosyltransferase family 4 protein [Dehalococcoidia bacterium]